MTTEERIEALAHALRIHVNHGPEYTRVHSLINEALDLKVAPTPPAAEGDWIHADSMLAVIDASVQVHASKAELVASLRALPRVSRDSYR